MIFDFHKKTPLMPKGPKVVEVYVGVDFGTTFTKVSYQIGAKEGTTKYSLRFGSDGVESDYCLPSVLGYDGVRNALVFCETPDKHGLETVRYFKYSMIEKGVPRNKNLEGCELRNDPQRLCSAFYIAHVLDMAKKVVLKHLSAENRQAEIRWYVNMGVPVSDFNAKPKPVYDEALNVAWKLGEESALQDAMGLAEIDRFYSRWLNHSTWSQRMNTVPELYAELIMFLQDKSVPTGFYSVIDIGGGTVDLAVFFKRIDTYTKNVEISCVAQDVCPLGYEMYRQVVGGMAARAMMRSSYGGLVNEAYHHHHQAMQKAKKNNNKLIHFYMGGARNVEFYHSCVDYMANIHSNAWSCYPGFAVQDMVKYMRGKAYLDVDNNSRLLISQMLAQPFETMPELVGQPWHFNKFPHYKNAPSPEELQLAIYGD